MRAIVVTISGMALFAAACGSAPSAPPARVDGKDAYADYISCLQKQGMPVPSGVPSIPPPDPNAPRPTGPQFPGGGPTKPPGVADDAWAAAKNACAYIIPQL
ncbi:hypothetical protein [Kutzneria sp. NPDC052558]|uniref:hypothetical protein n=1 Tax=Kutzneria sp. NPDC052558 TaxID=3364121 RepID=UPI0037C91D8B